MLVYFTKNLRKNFSSLKIPKVFKGFLKKAQLAQISEISGKKRI
jgi:hypothetical protein